MNWKKVSMAVGAGVLSGYIVTRLLNKQMSVTPEKALKYAKEAFKKEGPINGSWIYMKPENILKNDVNYTVYRGGVTRMVDGENVQYEFCVDTETGLIVDVAKYSPY